MEEFVIQNTGCEPRVLYVLLLLRFFGASDPSLAEHRAVFLPRDLFRHLENHLHQCIVGKALRAPQKHAGLAEVLDNAFIPAPEIFHPVTDRSIEFEAPRPRNPSGLANPAAAAPRGSAVRRTGRLAAIHALSASHGAPIITILDGAQEANLIVLTISTPPRPGKLVGAAA